jgi:hypothetical protein
VAKTFYFFLVLYNLGTWETPPPHPPLAKLLLAQNKSICLF